MTAPVLFLGTPDAALPTLESIAGEHRVGLVVTQPDRPKGRSGTPTPPPVKDWALEHGLAVAQPNTSEELTSAIDRHGPFEVGVVVAYGRILRREALDSPRHGMVNVHFSLLPRWRGAAPVARALMAGDEMTGVTIMKLDEGLDTGPVITAQAIDIRQDDDAGSLTRRLAGLGGRLVADALPKYLNGELEPVPQSDDGVTYAEKISREDRPIDPRGDAKSIVDKVRGLSPTPAATLVIDGDPHKILKAQAVDADVEAGSWKIVDGQPVIGVGDGAVAIISLQPPGKTPQSGVDWANGRRHAEGSVA